jgi:hypothetical protein
VLVTALLEVSLTRSHDADAGSMTLGRLVALGALVFFISLVFLNADVRHRVDGYRIIHGQGVAGTVTVTSCEEDVLSRVCYGDFVSSDGSVHRRLRVNGPPGMGPAATYPAAIGGPHADEAWTLQGKAWARVSKVQLTALVPVALVVVSVWTLVSGGPVAWAAALLLLRTRRSAEQESARQEAVRLGRVH